MQKSPITSSTNIKIAAQNLVSRVDIIYLPLDNSVVSGLTSLIQVATQANIPVIANDLNLVNKGLLLALGSDYFTSGEQLWNMIADMIEGKPLKATIQISNIKELKINADVAAKLKIEIPADLKNVLKEENKNEDR